jgi:phosphoadenosine phosphosulfate reductase
MTTSANPSAPSFDTQQACEQLRSLSALERMRWGLETFGDGFALTTSFGIQAAVSLHLVSQLERPVPVIWVDTGYLPPETYQYSQLLVEHLGLKLHVAQSGVSPARMEALHGRLWETGQVEDLETYHRIRKVEPLDRALNDLKVTCWASGVRGGQTDHRKAMEPVQLNGLPQHPLFEKGYSTVGDWHSSAPDDGSTSGRATRFGGLKQECGIHLPGMAGEGI